MKAVAEPLAPPAAERFFKIRSKITGLYKIAGIAGTGEEDGHRRAGGWTKTGKIWNKKSLAGHFALFLRTNDRTSVWVHGSGYVEGPCPRPELEIGAPYYAIPEEYEVVEFFALGEIVPLQNVMRAVLAKGAVISPDKA